MKTRWALLALAATLVTSPVWAQESNDQAATEAQSDAQSRQSRGHFVDVCFGGLQGGKVIVPDSRVVDDEVETSAKACRIDGGHRATVPRSPIIPAGSDAIA